MKKIAAWIAHVLADVGDADRQSRVRQEVSDFAKRFQVP